MLHTFYFGLNYPQRIVYFPKNARNAKTLALAIVSLAKLGPVFPKEK
jgi:hypothetical protein